MGVVSLGTLMNVRKSEGKEIEMPDISSEDDDEVKSMIKALVLKMICPEADDRYKIEVVCQKIDDIKRY